MISLFKVFLKAYLWRDFVSSLNEFQILAPLNLINLPFSELLLTILLNCVG